MKKIQMVDLQSQYFKIKEEVDKEIFSVINSTQFIKGPAVKEFENNLQKYLNVKHVISCANGTDALQIALMAMGLKAGDEVITTNFTFIANKTKAIIPVHLFGQAANMEKLMKIADENNLFIIEDNAQAIGADYIFSANKKQKLGTIGDIGCTSFFPSKNLGCFGDGGAVFTNNDEHAKKLRSISNHGMSVRYYHDDIGVNSRLDSIQAAVLNVKLNYLDEYCDKRRKVADYYDKAFLNHPNISTPKRAKYSTHVFHQYTLIIKNDKRDALKEYLSSKNIPAMIYYPVPLHMQKAYIDPRYKKGDFSGN